MIYQRLYKQLSDDFLRCIEELAMEATDSLMDPDLWPQTSVACDYDFMDAYFMGAEIA